MSIDLLHRINASERRFRRGRKIIGEFVVDEDEMTKLWAADECLRFMDFKYDNEGKNWVSEDL